ncbi:hypothetical protein SCLO_1031180 [Sphingobium cloacae]|uniref:Uncharacterized protein n=2 Tax=Sphingobium cloacae TaxID=120107 RepID=A0A1E1F6K8_9SPHN|nr:hypothetical protein SCLO_1031180 [Sphingobium cloacae]
MIAGMMMTVMPGGISVALGQSAPVEDGTYMLEGGSYSISVERTDSGIMVHEPNKHSPYRPAGADRPNTYLFFNDNTGYTYGIRGVDSQTIEAFKDVEGNVPTRLKRLGGPPSARPIRAIDPGPSGAPPEGTDAEVARKYQALSNSDEANRQSWTACSAAALKRSLASGEEADAYGVQVAQMLRLIAVDDASPCPDAIPQALWDKAKGIDDLGKGKAATAATTKPPAPAPDADREERLRLNADMAAKAASDAERIKADKDGYAAAMAEAQRAREQYQRERETYEAEAARVKAAQDAYEAEMARYRAAGGRLPR